MISAVDTSNMGAVVRDVHTALRSSPSGPSFTEYTFQYEQLKKDLEVAIPRLPAKYQPGATQFLQTISAMGLRRYWSIFFPSYYPPAPADQELFKFYREIIPDIALAILLQGQGTYERDATAAFQEVVSDLYDRFLAAESRRSLETGMQIKPPEHGLLPPLVKWGNPDAGPYTWPADATKELQLSFAVVSMPPAFAKGGLAAWSSLGHETGGHDIAHADDGLLTELTNLVHQTLNTEFRNGNLAAYWARCIDETTSDVLGCKHMGPAAGIGLVSFFRALSDDGKLRVYGGVSDPHPIDVLRGFVIAKVIAQSRFSQAGAWGYKMYEESAKDLLGREFFLVDERTRTRVPFPADRNTAVLSAYRVAEIISNTKLNSLEGHSLSEILDWQDSDQAAAEALEQSLVSRTISAEHLTGHYAGHAVAAATMAAFKAGAIVPQKFAEMIEGLVRMNCSNETWRYRGEGRFAALFAATTTDDLQERMAKRLPPAPPREETSAEIPEIDPTVWATSPEVTSPQPARVHKGGIGHIHKRRERHFPYHRVPNLETVGATIPAGTRV